MIPAVILSACLSAAPALEWGDSLQRTGATTPAPTPPAPAPSPDPDVTPGPFRAAAPPATLWRLADSTGQVYTHADRDYLMRWVAARNAGMVRYRASCPTGTCPVR
jgi:hypothetical protein